MAMKRECGNCTLCCKLLGVPALAKPHGKWCEHCDKGRGCKIYENRPNVCRAFECGWLTSELDIEFRPDHSHVMITGESDMINGVILHADPNYPHAFEQGKGKMLLDIIARQGKAAILVMGDRRKIIATDMKEVQRIQQILGEIDVK